MTINVRSCLALVLSIACVHAPPDRPIVASTRVPPPASFDRDGDGIADSRDRCPDLPEDCDAVEDNDGCPDADRDGDRIPDVCDRCPDSPEIYGPSGLFLDGCHEDPPRIIEGPARDAGPSTPPPAHGFGEDGRCPDGSTPTPSVGRVCTQQ